MARFVRSTTIGFLAVCTLLLLIYLTSVKVSPPLVVGVTMSQSKCNNCRWGTPYEQQAAISHGSPLGQGAGDGARSRDRRVPADLRADSLTTVPPTPPNRGRCASSLSKKGRKLLRKSRTTLPQLLCSSSIWLGVGGTADGESTLRSSETLLSRIRALSPAPRPYGRPEA
ncbi:hypothetical protein PoB_001828900 [Plakobranchus ocellatus]|uniref:Uncharacterized protein n=1 Tax=Plakobranchus ocellatus TaxID=259542 RepID=A0AAV3Z8Y3_9GAST|nr:hypothetical protein PoB_001828900 [Plakobranchus ocellatus]